MALVVLAQSSPFDGLSSVPGALERLLGYDSDAGSVLAFADFLRCHEHWLVSLHLVFQAIERRRFEEALRVFEAAYDELRTKQALAS